MYICVLQILVITINASVSKISSGGIRFSFDNTVFTARAHLSETLVVSWPVSSTTYIATIVSP